MNIIIEGTQGCGKTFAAWNIINGITSDKSMVLDMIYIRAPYTSSATETLIETCASKTQQPKVILYDEVGVNGDYQVGLCIEAVNRYRIKSGNKNVVAIIVKQS